MTALSLPAARREAEECLAAYNGFDRDHSTIIADQCVGALRSLLAALPDEGETPALTGLEAALVGDRPAPQPAPTLPPSVEAAAEALRVSIKRQGADWREKAWALLDSLASLSSARAAKGGGER